MTLFPAAALTRIRVWDCETTGMPPDAALCEIGYVDVINGEIGASLSTIVNPGRPIQIEAMAVHHLTEADVMTGVSPTEACRMLMDGGPDAFAAHNADFEKHFFAGGDRPWIDTWKVALRLWPDLPSHSNQALRYGLGLNLPAEHAMPPHRALPDAYVTARILQEAMRLATLDEMVAWSAEPAVLARVPFGKHRGAAWSAVPLDYLQWIMRQDMDANVKHSARMEIRKREAGE